MYDYTRYGIEEKLRPRTSRRVAGRIFSALLKLLVFAFIVLTAAACIYAFVSWNTIVDGAPDITGVTFEPGESATYICDQEGKRIQKLTLPEANRDIVNLSDVPADLQHAVVAIEDSRFYEHRGIDPVGIARALVTGLKARSFSQGASTITQQLLKNSVFPGWTQETTFKERLERKIQEQYLALKLEKILTKDQILEYYLNLINLGAGCYGVQAAAYRYFGKSVSDLTLAESAVIAGITQNPTAYNPITNPENNKKRRKMVLDAMRDQGYIDQKRYDEAMADDAYARIQEHVTEVDTTSSVYTFYQDALIAQVMQDLQDELAYTYQQAYRAVYSGGLRIYSAQDMRIQQICDEEFENPENFPAKTQVGIDYALSVMSADKTVTDYGNQNLITWIRAHSDPSAPSGNLMYDSAEQARADAAAFRQDAVKEGDTVLGERITITPQPQASCVVIDQSTGLVAALVGGRGDKEASLTLNRASYTTRQPGSTFKILTVYAPAIENRAVTLASTIVDEPYSYGWGAPVNNASRTYAGEVTIRRAIAESINVPAVKLLTRITPQVGYDFAKKMGITTLTDHYETDSGVLTDVGQTLALGGITRGVTNLDLTGAYAGIANMGHAFQPKFYTEVLDQRGNVILDNTHQEPRTVMKESTAQILTSAMEDVILDEAGTAHGLIDLGAMSVAGKTGTTSEFRDSWFVGYTPYYTCGIWAGYDNNEILPDEDRYHTFSRILWNAVMNRISALDTPARFHLTQDVMTAPVCTASHMAASVRCPQTYDEMFEKGTQPQYYCNIHGDGSLAAGKTGGIGGNGSWQEPAPQEPAAQEPAADPGDTITIWNTDSNVNAGADDAEEAAPDFEPEGIMPPGEPDEEAVPAQQEESIPPAGSNEALPAGQPDIVIFS